MEFPYFRDCRRRVRKAMFHLLSFPPLCGFTQLQRLNDAAKPDPACHAGRHL